MKKENTSIPRTPEVDGQAVCSVFYNCPHGIVALTKVETLTDQDRGSRSALRGLGLRTSEWVTIAFFAYVAAISPWFSDRPYLKSQPLFLFVAVTVAFVALSRAEQRSRYEEAVRFARDLLPLAAMLVAFKEMGYFQPAHFTHHYENVWIRWDDLVLQQWHLRSWIESTGAVLPVLFETCYVVVYAVGLVGVAVLYLLRRRKDVDRFLAIYISGTLLAYALFPFFSSQPPRIAFPHVDAPEVWTFMRSFNFWILEKGTIHSSVFPSAHVSSAFSAAWAFFFVLPRRKMFGSIATLYAVGVAVATVYGRYHYVADVMAGFGISIVTAAAFWIGSIWKRRRARAGNFFASYSND